MGNDRKRMRMPWRVLIALAAVQIAAWGQAQVVSSVVDAASYTPTLGSPGSIAIIFGKNLATAAVAAPGALLPRELGGTSVTWNGIAAPLFYVSPTQINLQIPARADDEPHGKAQGVVVYTAAGDSVLYNPRTATPDTWYVAGLFSTDGSGCGQGAVLNVAPDGSMSVNSAANSASPGSWIAAYGTGVRSLGAPDDGIPTPSSPLRTVSADLEFDLAGLRGNWQESWSGLAPGFVGLNQFNVRIPATVREGCAVPVQVWYRSTSSAISQPVTLAIRNGGGPCVDPLADGYGQVTWQRTVATNSANEVSESDTLTVSLQASPGKQAPPAPVYSDVCDRPGIVCYRTLTSSFTYFGPACPVPGYRSLDAGAVSMQGPGLGSSQVPVVPFQEGQLSGLLAYQATLAKGAAQAGTYTVTASGGAGVGPFQATAQVGAGIQLQTPLAGADVWAGCAPFTINWTGGDPNSWVTIRFIQQASAVNGGYQAVNFGYRTRTSKGALTVPQSVPGPPQNRCTTPTPVTISIEVDPDPSDIKTFSAPGLSLGGQVTWKYIHTLAGTIRLS